MKHFHFKSYRPYLLYISLVWAVTFAERINAQNRQYLYFKLEDGISSEGNYSNQCLLQDRNGFLWVATGNGLNKFDGKNFKVYEGYEKNSNGLGSNAFTALCEDANGQIWVGTPSDGIYVFDPATEKFTHITSDKSSSTSLSGNGINFIKKGPENNLWIGTRTNGLCRFNWKDKTFQRVSRFRDDTKADARQSGATDIHFSPNGTIWLGTFHGLHKYDKQSDSFNPPFSPYPKNSIRTNYGIYSIAEDMNGELWTVSGFTGRKIFNPETEKFRDYPTSFPLKDGHFVRTVSSDQEGKIWVGAEGGIIKYDPAKKLTDFLPHIENNLQSAPNYPFCFHFPKQGEVWIMTSNEGLVYLKNTTIPFQPLIENMQAFTPDKKGNLYILSDDGISIYNQNTGIQSNEIFPDKIKNHTGTSIHLFPNNELAILDYVAQTALRYHFDTEKVNLNRVSYGLVATEKNEYWVTHDLTSLHQLDSTWNVMNELLHRRFGKKENHLVPPSVFLGQNGNIWGATGEYGIYVYDLKIDSFYFFNDNNQYSKLIGEKTIIEVFHQGANGDTYIGTKQGLLIISPDLNIVEHVTKENGLPSNSINGIAEDAEGNLWLASFYGLTYYNRKEKTTWNFLRSDGLPGTIEHNTILGNDIAVGMDGKVYAIIGSTLYSFDPKKLMKQEKLESIKLVDLFLNNNIVEVGDSTGILPQSISTATKINLKYDQSDFSFAFSSPTFSKADALQYFYQLENHDRDWRKIGNVNKANYSNVPPGEYVFKVKAQTPNGTWTPNEAQILVNISPPWWKTWWAYLGYIILIMGSIIGIYKFQLNRKMEQAEARRLSELDSLKTRLYTNITHEFRTPLTVIMGVNENIEGAENERQLIRRNSKNLLRLVNQLLDLSKLDSGTMKMDMVHGEIIHYLRYLTESFYSMAEEKDVKLIFNSNAEEIQMDYDEVKIQHIIYNLLSNAIKFTNNGGKVALRVEQKNKTNNDFIQIKVSDTGIGIVENELANIFDRFYQTDSTSTRKGEGTGIGLALTKELVEMMGGTIAVESQLGMGSNFIVLLPIKKEKEKEELFAKNYISNIVQAENKKATSAHSDTAVLSEIKTEKGISGGNDSVAKPLLLLIEDNKDVATYISQILEKDYEIIWEKNGKAGVEKAFETVPDIIISDVMMPEKDGYEVTHILKNDERTSHIPIILLTAKAMQEDKVTGLKAGADAYLMKPFHKEELFVRLKKLLELREALRLRYQEDISWLRPATKKPLTPAERAFKKEDEFLTKLREAVESNMDNPEFDVPQLCQSVFLSHTHVYRKLKALIDKTPSQFIRRIRLQKGLELIQTTDQTISEIAYDTGFSDPAYFSRMFSKEFGKPPSAFRK